MGWAFGKMAVLWYRTDMRSAGDEAPGTPANIMPCIGGRQILLDEPAWE